MEKRGFSTWGFTLMLGVTIIILILGLSGVVKDFVDDARGAEGLNVTNANATISDYDKAAGITSDLSIFYFIGGVLLIGIGIITAKVILT